MKQSLLASALVCILLAQVAAQQPVTPSKPQTPDEVVRITTNLVQIDTVVTDRRGQQIVDLRPEEFEVYEDGRIQEIKNFSYVSLQREANTPTAVEKSRDKNAPATPPEQLRPDQVRRSIALVVDDLGLSFESTYYVRNALRKFVDEQMQPGDLVAIIRTGAGVGALQQFTHDRQLLYAAIDRLMWNAFGRGGISGFGNIGDDAFYTEPRDPKRGIYTATDLDKKARPEARETADRGQANDFKEEVFTVGTLGALSYVVRGLRELPGRKSTVLITDSLDLFNSTGGSNYRVLDALRHLIDLANRSSVVFYTLDARGLQTLNASAANSLSGKSEASGNEVIATGLSGSRIMQDLMSRSLEIQEAQNGMNYLASQTGGFMVSNNNDIALGIRRVLDQKGNYLLGYRPGESTFNPTTGRKQFHKLDLGDGITFGINLPVRKPGAFQLRVAVRDVPTERVGSANQFIAVPNLNKNRLTLSGLYVAGNVSKGSATIPAGHDAGSAGNNEGELTAQDPRTGPAVRRFRPGTVIDYGYEAYNVRLDRVTGRAQLQTQVRLFRDNQQAFASQVLSVAGQPDMKRVVAMAHLKLGQNLKSGDYVLQVIVTDAANKEKPHVASQWITFDLE